MLKPYGVRVKATYDLLAELLRELDAHPGALHRAVARADADTAALVHDPAARIPLRFEPTGKSVPFTLRGYAFTQTPSEISGEAWTQYDPQRKKTYTIPFFRDLRIAAAAPLPAAYLVPAAWQGVVAKLAQHGLRVERLAQARRLHATAWRLSEPKWADKPFENHLMLAHWQAADEARDDTYPEGSVLVPMDQPGARLVAHLLEPEAPDSLLRWNYFDIVFEQREYADARVAERIARDLLAAQPDLKAQFEQRLADPAFARDPAARLDFFFQRSPWHDERLGLYPVVRLDAAALAQARATQ
jgi:hypothetical protein